MNLTSVIALAGDIASLAALSLSIWGLWLRPARSQANNQNQLPLPQRRTKSMKKLRIMLSVAADLATLAALPLAAWAVWLAVQQR